MLSHVVPCAMSHILDHMEFHVVCLFTWTVVWSSYRSRPESLGDPVGDHSLLRRHDGSRGGHVTRHIGGHPASSPSCRHDGFPRRDQDINRGECNVRIQGREAAIAGILVLHPILIVEDVEDGHGQETDRHDGDQRQDRALDPPVSEYWPLRLPAVTSARSLVLRGRGGHAPVGLDGPEFGQGRHADCVSLQLVNPVSEVISHFAQFTNSPDVFCREKNIEKVLKTTTEL